MTAGRPRRRLVATVALTSGVIDLLTAAEAHTHVRFGVFRVAVDVVFGARYALLVAGLTLVLVARGLLHGKRNAARLALVAALVSVPGHHLKEADLVGLLAALAVVALIVVWRDAFPARSDPGLARQGLRLLIVGLLATFAYGAAGLWLLDEEFRETTTITRSLATAARLLFLLRADVEPISRRGRWFVESVRVAALTVVLVALGRLVATVVLRGGRRTTDEAVVRRLLDAHGTTALGHFHLLDDKVWFIEGEAFIGYKVVGTVALALGEPVGAPDARLVVARAFVAFCAGNGWIPAFHQVTDAGAAELRGVGLRALKIGEEAIVDVQHFDLEAKEFKSLRSALRRVERAACTVERHDPPHSGVLLDELRSVSDAWLAAGSHRERTFTLGRFDRAQLDETTIVSVVEDGHVVAFANVLPSYRGPDGNFDLMRRRTDAPNGVMDVLFVALIERFRAEGRDGMTLGLAPLSGISGDSLSDRALRLLYERGGAVFNFEGLRRFKEKWHPRWEPRWLCYPADTDLARVARAVARAGELPDPRTPWARVGAFVRRFPFATAVTTVVVWLMAATAADRALHRQLIRHFGLAWGDLGHLQLWRLPTAQFVQTRPGFVWTNLILAVVLFLAEWRLASRRTIAVFFLGDWISTLLVLVGVRIAAAAGSMTAARILVERDTGLSSGLWALAAAVAVTASNRRVRTVLGALVALDLVGSAVIAHRLFDVQHLVAALVGAALAIVPRDGGRVTADPV